MTPDHTSRELVELLHADALLPNADCPLIEAWREAEAEAQRAYDAWHEARGVDAYVVYLAAEDRAAAAQDELASWMQARSAFTSGPAEGVVAA